MAYPAGTGSPLHWRISGKPVDNMDPLVDVQFILDLIDDLESRYSIDPQHIYTNGQSNGGGMSYLLSCTLSAVGSGRGCLGCLHGPANGLPARAYPAVDDLPWHR